MFHTGGRKESYGFKYKKICKDNSENNFIFAHSRPLIGTINVMRSCQNVYCDIAFTPIKDIKVLLNNYLIDRILFGTDYPITSFFYPQIDKNKWYKQRMLDVKSIMSDNDFKKITYFNFKSLFNGSSI